MPDAKTEHVMVVPAAVLDQVGRFQGFTRDVDRYVTALLRAEHIRYRPRAAVEEDPSWKQIIPYCILRSGDRVFRYTRGRKQGETRLHDLESIGVGGHISADDRSLFNATETPYRDAMFRELGEEVVVESPYAESCVGLINDDSTPVGQVHLGIVHLFELAEPRVRRRESALTQAGFVDLRALRAGRTRLESWSQFCLDGLFA
jgi:predicted NUDIX family phosphoesterase